ncbi:MAG: hypothetical protein GWN00_01345 [Aliifodinibius sp.]|nr:hypothetical protein [Fodinibius sp.]NIY23507.1 hypothetical protein [Fodinibius sp.]
MKDIKKHFAASEATIEAALSEVDIPSIQTEEDSKVTIELLGDPPVVNGVNLLEHPNKYQRKKYQNVINSGGRIALTRINTKRHGIITQTALGKYGKTIQDFEGQRRNTVHAHVVRRVIQEMEPKFTRGRRGLLKAKKLTPEDFWALFEDRELRLIKTGLDATVQSFINRVDGSVSVNLQTKTMAKDLRFLLTNNYISEDTYSDILDEAG